ncbi:MAG: DUF2723 domain-containing protein, partial [bacterium]
MAIQDGPKKNVSGGPAARRRLLPAALFLAFFGLYLHTAAPDFLFDDNPEFIAAAHTLGITHPPGYSLFVLATKLFTYLAPGAEAFSANCASAFFGALAVVMAFHLAAALGCGLWTALAGAALFGVSRTFWLQSVQAEVYAPNAFFTALCLWLAVGIRTRSDSRRLLLLVLALAAGTVFHYSIILLVPVILIFLLLRRALSLNALTVAAGALAVLAVMTCLLYLPLRSAARPDIYWGAPETWNGFVEHVRGVQTMRGLHAIPWFDKLRFVSNYGRQLLDQFSPLLLPLALPGLFFLFSRRRTGFLLLGLYALNVLVFTLYLNYLYSERAVYVLSVFYIPSYLLFALCLALGAEHVSAFLSRHSFTPAPLFGLVLLLALVSAVQNHGWTNRNDYGVARNYASNMLDTVERDGILFAPIEVEAFPLACLRTLSNRRPDVRVYGQHGTRADDVYTAGKMEIPYEDAETISGIESFALSRRIDEAPIYYTLRRPFEGMPQFEIFADGLIYRVNAPRNEIFFESPWDNYNTDGVSYDKTTIDYVTRSVISKYGMRRAEHFLQMNLFEQAFNEIDRVLDFNPNSRFLHFSAANIYLVLDRISDAISEYEKALAVPPEHVEVSIDTVAVYNNLSSLYGRLGRYDEALRMVEEAVRLAPHMAVLRVNLGKTYWHNERYEEAAEQLEEALHLGGQDASVYNILGICHEKLKKYDKAEENYMNAIRADPDYVDAYRDAGIFFAYVRNDPEKAIPLLTRYIELAPATPDRFELLMNIALLHRQLKHWDDSFKFLVLALEAKKDMPPDKSSRIFTYIGECLEGVGKQQDAIRSYEKALYINPLNPSAQRNLGLMLVKDPARHADAL